MTKVYITDYITNPNIEREILGNELISEPNPDVEILLVWHQKVDACYLAQFPNLKAVIRYGVGFDNIDLAAATCKGVVVCNTPDYGTDEVSDTALAMIMNIVRGVKRYDTACRYYKSGWQEHVLPEIRRTSDIKLGIIGAGRIGSSVLLKSKALRFQTYFYDPFVPRGYEKTLDAIRFDSLKELLVNSDIISIHCPLNENTEGMIDNNFVSQMKPGASLINTARGKILGSLDTLYEPLRSNHLNCVALDVIPEEPPTKGRLIGAWQKREDWLDGRLIINPHTAYYSDKAYKEMRQKAALNARRVLDQLKPFNILNEVEHE